MSFYFFIMISFLFSSSILIDKIFNKLEEKVKNKEYLYISSDIDTNVHEVCVNSENITLTIYDKQRIIINNKSLKTTDYIDKNKFISEKLLNHILSFFKYKNIKVKTYLLVSRTENNHILYDFLVQKFKEWKEFINFYEELVEGNFLILYQTEKKINTKYFVKLIDTNCVCYYVKCIKTNLYFKLFSNDIYFRNLIEIEINRKYENKNNDLKKLNTNIKLDENKNKNTETYYYNNKKYSIYNINIEGEKQIVHNVLEKKSNKFEEYMRINDILSCNITKSNYNKIKISDAYEKKSFKYLLSNPWFKDLEKFICIETEIWSIYLFYESHKYFLMDFFEKKRFTFNNKIRTYNINDEHLFIKNLKIQILPCEIRINNFIYSNITNSKINTVKNSTFIFMNKYFDVVDQILKTEYSIIFLFFNSTLNTIISETIITEILKSPLSGEYIIFFILLDAFSIFNEEVKNCKKNEKLYKIIVDKIRKGIQNFLFTNTYKLFVILYYIKFVQLIKAKKIDNVFYNFFWILKDSDFIEFLMSYEFNYDYNDFDIICKRKKEINDIFNTHVFFLFKSVLNFEKHFYFIENGIDSRICDSYRCLMHELYYDEQKKDILGIDPEKMKDLIKIFFK